METKVSIPKSLYVLISLVLIVSLASLSIGAVNFSKFNEKFGEKSEETTEDGVIIAGEYEVKSTTQISDAYKSGDNSHLSEKDKETLDMATAVVDEVIKEGMTDFDKEKAIFDWIIKNLGQDRGLLTVIPTSGEDSDNPYGVLKYKAAVCVGYATTFRLFMQMLDIPCMVVHETGLYHTWDLVQIEDNWYHVDCFSSVNNKNYRYFNMTDNMCMQSWDKTFYPHANSVEHNMAYRDAKKTSDVYEVASAIRKAFDKKETMVSLLFPKNFTERDAQIGNNIVNKVQEQMWSLPDYSEWYADASWFPLDDGNLMMISISYGPVLEQQITPEDEEKIQAAVEAAFADLTENPEGEEGEEAEGEEVEEIEETNDSENSDSGDSAESTNNDTSTGGNSGGSGNQGIDIGDGGGIPIGGAQVNGNAAKINETTKPATSDAGTNP